MREELPQNSPILHQQAAYWRHRLSGELPVLELPFDHPRPPVSSFMREKEQRVLGEKIYQKLRDFCAQRNISVFVVLLAALKILLVRYTGEKDVIVGWVSNGLQHLGTPEENENEGITNPVVLRTDLSDDPRVSAILNRVADTVREAVINRQHPFQTVVQEMGRDNLSRSLPFSVMFDMEDLIEESLMARRAEAQSRLSQKYRVQCDFILNISIREQFVVQVEYDAELFEPATMRRLLTHYQRLLESLVDNPTQDVSHIPLLPDTEQLQLLVEWNPPVIQDPPPTCVHHLFEAQAARTPEAVAVIINNQQLTYRALNERANQLAHFLKEQGVGPEVYVGICLERGLELVISLLGILKAGGAYVPLDPVLPTKRLDMMLGDAQVVLVLTQMVQLPILPHAQTLLVPWETLEPKISHQIKANPMVPISPNNLAYLIYTSGSAGTPKGIAISHGALHNHMAWMQKTFAFTTEDRVLQKTSLSFDASIWEYWMPLLTGGRLVMAESEDSRDFPQLIHRISRHQVTHLQMVPSTLNLLLQEPGFSQCHSLRHLFSGGEVLSRSLQQRCDQTLSATLHNLYGPTETTIDITAWTCRPALPLHHVPIGRPITNTQIFLVDKFHQLVPIGIVGEILVGGASLSRGYWNQPAQTAEQFQPNPFSHTSGERLYHTGDLARHHPTGTLEYLGRLDHQIKLRGHRIELGEIESVLSRHPAVREVVVQCREDVSGDKQLVAYVTKAQDTLEVSEVRTYLHERLPVYMVPSAFVILEALPLTANGKIDRKALPAPTASHMAVETTYVPPRTPLEEMLAEVWGDLLKGDQIGIHDNFFALGGHSLLATQVVARIRNVLELDLPLRTLFEHPTVAQLARKIDTQLTNAFPDWPKDKL